MSLGRILGAVAFSTVLAGGFAQADTHGKGHKKNHKKHHHHHMSEKDKLKHDIAQMMSRIDALENQEKRAAVSVVQDGADDKISVKLSGKVNMAAMWSSDGNNSSTQYVGNDNDGSVVTIAAEGQWNPDTTVGGVLETTLSQNQTVNTDTKTPSSAAASFSAQKVEVFGDNKHYGRLAVGRGAMASKGIAEETDLSETGAVANGSSGANNFAGGIQFVDKDTNQKVAFMAPNSSDGRVQVGNTFSNGDSSYQDRITYRTPNWQGFNFSAGHAYHGSTTGSGSDMWDAAVRYNGMLAGVKVSAGLSFQEDKAVAITSSTGEFMGNTSYQQTTASVGALFSNGISLMLAGGHRDWDRPNVADAHFGFAKLGYQHKFFDCGLTAFALDYGNFRNFIFKATDTNARYQGNVYGAFLVQRLDRVATDLYLGWRLYKLSGKRGGERFKDVSAVMGGARVTF